MGSAMIDGAKLKWFAAEACQWAGEDAKVVFRDKFGAEHPVAKIKVRGHDTIVICELPDD